MELIDTNALAAQLTCDCQSGSIKGHDWEMIVHGINSMPHLLKFAAQAANPASSL